MQEEDEKKLYRKQQQYLKSSREACRGEEMTTTAIQIYA
jgi:hypothetical protein